MSQLQKQYYRALLQKDLEVINAGGERKCLLNIAMQLRKCCNHPYLFEGAEPGPPYTSGEHLITTAGKSEFMFPFLHWFFLYPYADCNVLLQVKWYFLINFSPS